LITGSTLERPNHPKKIIIEFDGGQHAGKRTQYATRDICLKKRFCGVAILE
jgi:very-short-patch-repair endonuclease